MRGVKKKDAEKRMKKEKNLQNLLADGQGRSHFLQVRMQKVGGDNVLQKSFYRMTS